MLDASKTVSSSTVFTSRTGTKVSSRPTSRTAVMSPDQTTTKSTLSKKEQEELKQKLIDAIDDLKESE